MIYFTTTEPSGFLSNLNPDGPKQEILDEYAGAVTIADSLTSNTSIYIDGDLEQKMGFDIPYVLKGRFKDQEVQDAIAVDKDTGEEYPCKLILANKVDDLGKRKGYFVTPEQVDKTKTHLNT